MAWDVENRRDHGIEIYQHTLTGDTETTTTTQKVMGVVKQVFLEPGAGITSTWDLTLTDDPIDSSTDGPDLLNGQGTDIGTANLTLGPSDFKGGLFAVNKLKLTATGMGAAKTAKITVYLLRIR